MTAAQKQAVFHILKLASASIGLTALLPIWLFIRLRTLAAPGSSVFEGELRDVIVMMLPLMVLGSLALFLGGALIMHMVTDFRRRRSGQPHIASVFTCARAETVASIQHMLGAKKAEALREEMETTFPLPTTTSPRKRM